MDGTCSWGWRDDKGPETEPESSSFSWRQWWVIYYVLLIELIIA